MIPRLISKTSSPIIEEIMISFLSIAEAPALLSVVANLNIQRITSSSVYVCLKDISFFAYAGHKLFCSLWIHAFALLLAGYWPGKFTALVVIYVFLGGITMFAIYYGGQKICPKTMKLLDGIW